MLGLCYNYLACGMCTVNYDLVVRLKLSGVCRLMKVCL